MTDISQDELEFVLRVRSLNAAQREALDNALGHIEQTDGSIEQTGGSHAKPTKSLLFGMAAAALLPAALPIAGVAAAAAMPLLARSDVLKKIWDNPEDSDYDKL